MMALDHTMPDLEALTLARVASQPRERAVRCRRLGCQASTWNLAGMCDAHYERPARAREVLGR